MLDVFFWKYFQWPLSLFCNYNVITFLMSIFKRLKIDMFLVTCFCYHSLFSEASTRFKTKDHYKQGQVFFRFNFLGKQTHSKSTVVVKIVMLDFVRFFIVGDAIRSGFSDSLFKIIRGQSFQL